MAKKSHRYVVWVEQEKVTKFVIAVVKSDISGKYLNPTRGFKRVDYHLHSEYSLIQSVSYV